MTSMRSKVLHGLLLAGLLVSCVILYVANLGAAMPAQDEGILLTYPDLITRGFLPYRDFAALYMPGTFYVVAAAFRLFGASVAVEHWVGAAYWLLLVASMYALGRHVASWTGLLAAALCLEATSSFSPGAYAMIPAEAAAVGALACAATSGHWRWSVLSGALAVLSAYFRQDMGAVAIATLLLLHVMFLRRRLLAFLAGAMLCGLPMLTLFTCIGWAPVFQSVVLDVLRTSPGRRLPVTPDGDLILLLCACASVVVCAVIAVARTLARQDRVLCCGAALFSLGLVPSVLQRADAWHVSYTLGVVAGLTVVSMSVVFGASGVQLAWVRRLAPLAIGAWMLLLWDGVQRATDVWGAETASVVSGTRHLPEESAEQRAAMQALVDAMNKVPAGQRVFIGPADLRYASYNDSQLYFLWPHLIPASRYIEMNPGVANRAGSGLAEELASADLVVQTTRYAQHWEPNESAKPGSDAANQVIRRDFRLWKTFGAWHVLQRVERSSGLAKVE